MADEIVEKWKKLGRRLDVSDAKLHEIDQAHDQLSEKGYHLLKHWKQEKGPAATYQALCDALKHKLVQRQDLAVQFCYINGNYTLQIVLRWLKTVSSTFQDVVFDGSLLPLFVN